LDLSVSFLFELFFGVLDNESTKKYLISENEIN